ncbi:right-handed parallel beta-helix repeat-containing protein [Seonamhaeicola marinus]|uniref:Right-handed parallel beta-helix repeat-containing protein n=1 Tax=Seonamhaeicola marinus TaxID=1912246 RepID=A0A5D0HT22_9FLAO|nr:hypothetical protein [Seonamhaeicola marinus]TYA74425.1 hypothetical protein FUA24_13960 [Seonamhaeicola marinus]
MKTKLLFLTALLFACIVTAQSTITVDNSVGANAQYNDLQSAISAASNGDIIYVHASEINYGDIDITKPITLIGFSHGDTDKKTMIDEIDLLDNASNVTISGFNITDDINALNPSTEINNLIIENNDIEGTFWSNNSNAGVNNMIIRGNVLYRISSNSSTWTNYRNTIISNNVIRDWIYINFHESVTIKNNIFIDGSYPVNVGNSSGDLEVQNCIFYESSSATINANSTGVVYENCLSYNLGSGSYSSLSGSNNLNNQNPNFVSATGGVFDAENDDYNLQAGSPAIGSGVGGVDMGIYDGGSFTFNNQGYTNGIPTVKITNITDRIAVGANLSVTISTNAN